MRILPIATMLALAACAPESTSFRTTDQGDGSERTGPPAAAYRVADIAKVHVWSNGGYISTGEEPMSHVGFEIQNTSPRPIVFDSDALQLLVFDKDGQPLPTATFTAVTPLGPARVPIAAHETTTLDVYFLLPVRPKVVDTMRLHWSLMLGDERYEQSTSFVRDDDAPVAPAPPQTNHPSS
jgi:hypothetical protein